MFLNSGRPHAGPWEAPPRFGDGANPDGDNRRYAKSIRVWLDGGQNMSFRLDPVRNHPIFLTYGVVAYRVRVESGFRFSLKPEVVSGSG